MKEYWSQVWDSLTDINTWLPPGIRGVATVVICIALMYVIVKGNRND